MNEAWVLLIQDSEGGRFDGNKYVLVSDRPDSPCTVGALSVEHIKDEDGDFDDGWPAGTKEYAEKLAAENGGAYIEYESLFIASVLEGEAEDDE